jgi:O-antigen/teichoic acid export membrane protein
LSTFKRIASGSFVAWLSIGVTLIGQIVLVPVFLARWSAAIYGVWLALLAVVSFLSMLSVSYQNFLFGEFLKIGRESPRESGLLFWSAIPVAALLGLLEFILVIALYYLVDLSRLLGSEGLGALVSEGEIFAILLAYAAMNLLLMPIGGMAVKLLTVYGFYTRMTLWGLLRLVATLIAPAVAVYTGSSFLLAGLVWVAAHFAVALLTFFDTIILLRRLHLSHFQRPDWFRGFRALWLSQALLVRDFLKAMRNNGVRVLLASFLGSATVAIFSTNRTVANVLQRGVGTLSHPLLPELMHAVNRREQAKVEGFFGVIWLVLLGALIPGFILMQYFVGSVFEIWTQGKIAFDPMLFTLFAGTILLFTLSQPAYAIASGNNLLRIQLYVAVLVGLVAIGSIIVLVPVLGVYGAAIGLMIAELAGVISLSIGAARWMNSVGLTWPWRSQRIVFVGVIYGFFAMCLNCLSSFFVPLVLLSSALILFVLVRAYLRTLPSVAREALSAYLMKVPFLRKLNLSF